MKIRQIVSLTLFLCITLLLVSSLVLFVVPPGRVAYWTDWRFLGLSKTQWGELHTNLGFLLGAATIFHIVYNWKPILTYLKNKGRQFTFLKGESMTALGLVLVFAVSSIWGLPPVSLINDLGEGFKDRGAEKFGEPPYGHAELSSLRAFCRKVNLDPETSVRHLQEAGFVVPGPEHSLLEIAKLHGVAPKVIFDAMKPSPAANDKPTPMPEDPSPGTGRRILAELCVEYGLRLPETLGKLKARGFDAKPEDRIKEIADGAGRNPQDVYQALREIRGEQMGE